MSEDPEFLNLSAAFKRFRERMSPEVKQALFTILDAIFEGAPIKEDFGPAVPPSADVGREENGGVGKRQRPAERRTENAPQCRSTNHGERCTRSTGHTGAHSSGVGGLRWLRVSPRKHASSEAHQRYMKKRYGDDPSPRAKPAPPKPKPKSPSAARCSYATCALPKGHSGAHARPVVTTERNTRKK